VTTTRTAIERLIRIAALVRRRGWILVTSAAVVAAVAMATASRAPVTYAADAMVIVPSGASALGPGNAAEANRLAATYSEMIPASTEIDDHVARELGIRPGSVASALSVSNVAGTSLLNIRFRSTASDGAIKGVTSVLNAVAGPVPATGAIPQGSLVVVRSPREASSTSKPFGAALPIGVILGLFLGAILVVAWERADARVDDAVTLGEVAGCPASNLDLLSTASMAALLDRWHALANTRAVRVALIGVRRGQLTATTDAAEQLVLAGRVEGRDVATADERSVGHEMVIIAAGAPGGDESGESIALSSSLTVLVAPMSVRASDVRAAAATLRQFGAGPSWALITRQRWFRADVRSSEQDSWQKRALSRIGS
jgi:capsular polysaccharide biosynthesis protein